MRQPVEAAQFLDEHRLLMLGRVATVQSTTILAGVVIGGAIALPERAMMIGGVAHRGKELLMKFLAVVDDALLPKQQGWQ